MHYVATFNGYYSDASVTFPQTNFTYYSDLMTMRNTYRNSAGDLNEKGLEKLFFDTLTNIGIGNKVVLQRVEPDGTVYNVTQDSSGSITSTPCP